MRRSDISVRLIMTGHFSKKRGVVGAEAERYFLGIELGSTRIKAVLIDNRARVIAKGTHEWENGMVGGFWSYSLESVHSGLQASYAALAGDYEKKLGRELTGVVAVGVSAMMHGYLAFDENDRLLVPFRTWRNTNAGRAAQELTERFAFHVPQRFSVAHYAQAVLDREAHVKDVAFLTTLAGYVHYRLTGEKVLGIGDASGMFPVRDGKYDPVMLAKFNAFLEEEGIHKDFEGLLPAIRMAGENAGSLTEAGAAFLDVTGRLKAGCILCPPEGDAGTGMVATNSILPRTANVSAGTSAFLMTVLEDQPCFCEDAIDVVATPAGEPVAMVHVNNFTSEITAWANLFEEVMALGGAQISREKLFDALYESSLGGDAACGGLVGYNFLAGEPIVGIRSGIPMVLRLPGEKLTLAGFMKMQIYSALGALAVGCEFLKKQRVRIDRICGHGGFFKAPVVGQSAMSAAIGAPVTVMRNAGEGGAWGIALLALFAWLGEGSLADFLEGIFSDAEKETVMASEAQRAEFETFMKKYKAGLAVEKLAAEVF